MADFHQNGVISTLHNLSNGSKDKIEEELIEFSKDRPIELILPCLYSEIEGPALKNIINILSKVKYLNHIIIGLDKANKNQFIKAKKFFSALKQPHSILWNDGSKLSAIDKSLNKLNLSPKEQGK